MPGAMAENLTFLESNGWFADKEYVDKSTQTDCCPCADQPSNWVLDDETLAAIDRAGMIKYVDRGVRMSVRDKKDRAPGMVYIGK